MYDSIFPPADAVSGRRSVKRSAAPMPIAATGFSDRNQGHCRALQPLLSQIATSKPVTTSDLADVSMQSCLMVAPQLAEWMKQHPAERLAAWRRVIGIQDGRGA
jgi:hypothetical protein